MKVYKAVLKMLVEKGRVAQNIDSTTKTELDTLIDNLSKESHFQIKYSDFDQVASTNITFDDLNRTATSSDTNAELVTNQLSLSDISIKSLHVNSTGATVNQITTDNTVFHIVPEFNINEEILEAVQVIDFRIKIIVSGSGDVVSGMELVYDSVDV